MRAAALLLSLTAVLGCATDAADTNPPQQQAPATEQPAGDLAMRILTTGAFAAATPEAPRAVAAESADELRTVWAETIGNGTAPQVDFATESVVILLAGSKSTGGYSVEPRGVRLDGRTLVVDAEIKSPPPGAIVTQAFTSPFAVIAVNTKNYDQVRWTP